MPHDDAIRRGEHVMAVCNACRYCEQYCPVFPAMEQRLTFTEADLAYLANLCHNCGECLYACQYAPPHEFGINVPRTLAEIRLRSYEHYCWPRFLGAAFRHNSLLTALVLTSAFVLVMFVSALRVHGTAFWQRDASADFYAVVPHNVMVLLFGGVAIFALAAFWIGVRRFRRDLGSAVPHISQQWAAGSRQRTLNPLPAASCRPPATRRREGGLTPTWRALRDVLALRHLHGSGVDCTSAEEVRSRWRRWLHHSTFYGFVICFASTSVAAIYHGVFGWRAPYAYTSLPVVLGTVGGVGLLIGPVGLLMIGTRRDPELGDPAQRGLDESFIMLLFLTSLTGLVLLVLRHDAAMGALLIVHLGSVLALFVTLPYGKFVHGLYRTAALLKFAMESPAESGEVEKWKVR